MYSWVPDIGSNNHFTQDMSTFEHHEPYYSDDFLHIGNCKILPTLHVDSTCFYSPSKTFYLTNILHVPEKKIILSVKHFCQDNHDFLEITLPFLLLRTSLHAQTSSTVQVTTSFTPCVSHNFAVFWKSLLQLFMFLQTFVTKDLHIYTPNF